jgi:SAM-dependent methyltransferase
MTASTEPRAGGKPGSFASDGSGTGDVTAAAYWDGIADEWRGSTRAWRLVSDAVNVALLKRWLADAPRGHVLKTDLFDEFTGDGLVPWLRESYDAVSGIDISQTIVRQVGERCPGLEVRHADARDLPFASDRFDVVVSNSTLDHLPTREAIAVAVRELHRVVRPGGHLLITLDNPMNPVVRLRNALPRGIHESTRLVPYSVGATLGPRRLRVLLQESGFEVLRSGAVFHSPRVLVVLTGRAVDRLGPVARRRFVKFWSAFEWLGHLPTRYLTGYFVAALARKP